MYKLAQLESNGGFTTAHATLLSLIGLTFQFAFFPFFAFRSLEEEEASLKLKMRGINEMR